MTHQQHSTGPDIKLSNELNLAQSESTTGIESRRDFLKSTSALTLTPVLDRLLALDPKNRRQDPQDPPLVLRREHLGLLTSQYDFLHRFPSDSKAQRELALALCHTIVASQKTLNGIKAAQNDPQREQAIKSGADLIAKAACSSSELSSKELDQICRALTRHQRYGKLFGDSMSGISLILGTAGLKNPRLGLASFAVGAAGFYGGALWSSRAYTESEIRHANLLLHDILYGLTNSKDCDQALRNALNRPEVQASPIIPFRPDPAKVIKDMSIEEMLGLRLALLPNDKPKTKIPTEKIKEERKEIIETAHGHSSTSAKSDPTPHYDPERQLEEPATDDTQKSATNAKLLAIARQQRAIADVEAGLRLFESIGTITGKPEYGMPFAAYRATQEVRSLALRASLPPDAVGSISSFAFAAGTIGVGISLALYLKGIGQEDSQQQVARAIMGELAEIKRVVVEGIGVLQQQNAQILEVVLETYKEVTQLRDLSILNFDFLREKLGIQHREDRESRRKNWDTLFNEQLGLLEKVVKQRDQYLANGALLTTHNQLISAFHNHALDKSYAVRYSGCSERTLTGTGFLDALKVETENRNLTGLLAHLPTVKANVLSVVSGEPSKRRTLAQVSFRAPRGAARLPNLVEWRRAAVTFLETRQSFREIDDQAYVHELRSLHDQGHQIRKTLTSYLSPNVGHDLATALRESAGRLGMHMGQVMLEAAIRFWAPSVPGRLPTSLRTLPYGDLQFAKPSTLRSPSLGNLKLRIRNRETHGNIYYPEAGVSTGDCSRYPNHDNDPLKIAEAIGVIEIVYNTGVPRRQVLEVKKGPLKGIHIDMDCVSGRVGGTLPAHQRAIRFLAGTRRYKFEDRHGNEISHMIIGGDPATVLRFCEDAIIAYTNSVVPQFKAHLRRAFQTELPSTEAMRCFELSSRAAGIYMSHLDWSQGLDLSKASPDPGKTSPAALLELIWPEMRKQYLKDFRRPWTHAEISAPPSPGEPGRDIIEALIRNGDLYEVAMRGRAPRKIEGFMLVNRTLAELQGFAHRYGIEL